jgi:hypothetical protein
MSIDLYDAPAPAATGGTVQIQVSHGGWRAEGSFRAAVARQYAGDAISADVAAGWLAHALRNGLHKSAFAMPEVSYYAVSIAVAHGLGDKLTAGAILAIDIDTAGSGSPRVACRVSHGGAIFNGIDPNAIRRAPVSRGTLAKIDIQGREIVEVVLPSQAEFDRLRGDVSDKIRRGAITFSGHLNEQVAARLIREIVEGGQVEERRDELVGAIGALIEFLNPCQAASIADCGMVIYLPIVKDGQVTKGVYSIQSHS